jgi:hypothetical protein
MVRAQQPTLYIASDASERTVSTVQDNNLSFSFTKTDGGSSKNPTVDPPYHQRRAVPTARCTTWGMNKVSGPPVGGIEEPEDDDEEA